MICSYCSASMPEISGFCPACGRAVAENRNAESEPEQEITGPPPLSRDALLAGFAYVPIVPAIVFLLVPAIRQKRYVCFHAWQSLLLVLSAVVIAGVTRLAFSALSIFSSVGFLLAWLMAGVVALGLFFLWIAIILKAALGDAYQLVFIGPWSVRLSNR